MHRLQRMTTSIAEHYKSKEIIDSWMRPQDMCVREKVLSRATKNMSTHNKTKMIKSEKKNINKKILPQVSQGLSLNAHEEKLSMPLAVLASAKCCFEEKLRLNEIQITYLQERINRRNYAKLVNSTNISRNEFVFCSNNSWKMTQTDQQSVFQQCQFPCIISKTALMMRR